jgi:hypothetical protein
MPHEDRDWSVLNRHARRKYKFIQAESYAGVTDYFANRMPDGVCMGVAMNWIKEKLTTSDSLFRTTGPLRSSQERQFSNPLNPITRLQRGISPAANSVAANLIDKKSKSGERNRAAMSEGALKQHFFSQHGTSMLAIGLDLMTYDRYAPKAEVTRKEIVNANGSTTYIAERDDTASIRNAALDLPRGMAVLIEVVRTKSPALPTGGGHAIAFYRSRGNTLYFFDPNAGVYEVVPTTWENIYGLVGAWMSVYRYGDNIIWKTPDTDWCHVYRRKNKQDANKQDAGDV